MSGKSKLNRVTKNIRVVAMPSKKVETPILDENGQPKLDKDGVVLTEKKQLYRIKELK